MPLSHPRQATSIQTTTLCLSCSTPWSSAHLTWRLRCRKTCSRETRTFRPCARRHCVQTSARRRPVDASAGCPRVPSLHHVHQVHRPRCLRLRHRSCCCRAAVAAAAAVFCCQCQALQRRLPLPPQTQLWATCCSSHYHHQQHHHHHHHPPCRCLARFCPRLLASVAPVATPFEAEEAVVVARAPAAQHSSHPSSQRWWWCWWWCWWWKRRLSEGIAT